MLFNVQGYLRTPFKSVTKTAGKRRSPPRKATLNLYDRSEKVNSHPFSIRFSAGLWPSTNRGKELFQPYFHRRGTENAKKLQFLFFAERAKNKKSYPSRRTSLFLCRPLNGKGKNISLCVLCGFAVRFLFIRLRLFIEQIPIIEFPKEPAAQSYT